jgi:hypothetical protein
MSEDYEKIFGIDKLGEQMKKGFKVVYDDEHPKFESITFQVWKYGYGKDNHECVGGVDLIVENHYRLKFNLRETPDQYLVGSDIISCFKNKLEELYGSNYNLDWIDQVITFYPKK